MTAREWTEKYPFLKIKDNSMYPWLYLGDSWLNELPQGWIDGFCEKMCDELMEALGNFADQWVITQVKEKYGELRVYHAGLPENIYDAVEMILSKYAEISYHTCCVCGKEATEWSKGYIMPYCGQHSAEQTIRDYIR